MELLFEQEKLFLRLIVLCLEYAELFLVWSCLEIWICLSVWSNFLNVWNCLNIWCCILEYLELLEDMELFIEYVDLFFCCGVCGFGSCRVHYIVAVGLVK